MERKTLKLALEALKHLIGNQSLHYTYRGKAEKAITAIREALAQPAPVQWNPKDHYNDGWRDAMNSIAAQPAQEPDELTIAYMSGLYDGKKKRPWVEPTVGEWWDWWRVSPAADETEAEINFADFLNIAQAVVAYLKEKNT